MNWFKSAKELLAKRQVQEETAQEFFGNFTPRAGQVLALARKEADRLNHNFIGTEHILLGLIKLGQGVATNVLKNAGLNLENVRVEVEKHLGVGLHQETIDHIPFTPRSKRIFEMAKEESKLLKHTYVGTEHLLLGLLRENEGVAARIFKNCNLNAEQTRKEILNELNPRFFGEDDTQENKN
jgi:ATP-dependent Clp protease ATP-binding subunit ClpC